MDVEKDWKDMTVDVTKLFLDLENPRIPQHIKEKNDVNLIRNYLLEKEDVLRIAESIARNGYHRSAIAIVYQEGEKLVVLDGNRRLAACQFLLDPSLAPESERKKFEILQKELHEEALKKIKVTIAPSRNTAESEIWDIHVKQLLKPWEVLQKLRMYRNLIDKGELSIDAASKKYGIPLSKFKKELEKLFFYEKILNEVDEDGEEELLGSGFNKIDRIILSKNGKKLLKYKINNAGEILAEDKSLFNSQLKKVIPFIVNPKAITAQVSQDELIELVYNKIDPKQFPLKKTTDGKKAAKASKKVKAESQKKESFPIPKNEKINFSSQQTINILSMIATTFRNVSDQLLSRHDKRETLKITDEYDVQDLLHALLKVFHFEIYPEEWNPSYMGKSTRVDLMLKTQKIVIEVKKMSESLGKDALRKQLIEDSHHYNQNKECNTLVCFIYDPDRRLKDPEIFKADIEKPTFTSQKVCFLYSH